MSRMSSYDENLTIKDLSIKYNQLQEQRDESLELINKDWDNIKSLDDQIVKNFLKDIFNSRSFYESYTRLKKSDEKEIFNDYQSRFQGWADDLIVNNKRYNNLTSEMVRIKKKINFEKGRLKQFPKTSCENGNNSSISEVVSEMDIKRIDTLRDLQHNRDLLEELKRKLEEENFNFQMKIDENTKTILLIETKMKFFDVQEKYLNEVSTFQENIKNIQGI